MTLHLAMLLFLRGFGQRQLNLVVDTTISAILLHSSRRRWILDTTFFVATGQGAVFSPFLVHLMTLHLAMLLIPPRGFGQRQLNLIVGTTISATLGHSSRRRWSFWHLI
jgi:hypothetical protein